MPGTYQGGEFTTPNGSSPSTMTWAAATPYTAGEFVTPSPAPGSGQYFMATNSGTSSGSQPPWATPASLPVPGTTFVDGGVTWICVGSIFTGSQEVIVDVPLDADGAITATVIRALKNIANFLSQAAYLVANNLFTGTNTFDAEVITNGPLKANQAVGLSNLGILAAGTTQMPNSAGPIVLGPATGTNVVKLPITPAVVGQVHVFNCNTGTSLQILPPTGGALNGFDDVTGITITTYQTLRVFWDGVGGNWYTW